MPCSGWSVQISTPIFGHMSNHLVLSTYHLCHVLSSLRMLGSDSLFMFSISAAILIIKCQSLCIKFQTLSSVLWSLVVHISGHTTHLLDHSKIFYAMYVPLHGELFHWLKHLQTYCKFLSLLLSDSAKILCEGFAVTVMHFHARTINDILPKLT